MLSAFVVLAQVAGQQVPRETRGRLASELEAMGEVTPALECGARVERVFQFDGRPRWYAGTVQSVRNQRERRCTVYFEEVSASRSLHRPAPPYRVCMLTACDPHPPLAGR